MKILIACEYSGIVRDAFIKKGFDAVSCDLLPTEQPGPHIQGDVLKEINNGYDVLIGFPPCTHLAVSGAAHFEKKRKDGRQKQGIEFFMKLVNAPVRFSAIENPVSIMSSVYRRPDQIINPFYFGDPVPKKTCLWLKNLPPLFHAKTTDLFNNKVTHCEPEYIDYNSNKTKSGKTKYSVYGKLGAGKGHERSKTFQGIADAMAQQWGDYLKTQ